MPRGDVASVGPNDMRDGHSYLDLCVSSSEVPALAQNQRLKIQTALIFHSVVYDRCYSSLLFVFFIKYILGVG